MGHRRSPQTASLHVEELEPRSLPSTTHAPSVATIVNELRTDIHSLERSVDNLKLFTDTLVTNLVSDVKNGTDLSADLRQLERLTLPPGAAVANIFWDMRTKAGKAQDIQNDLSVMLRWGTQLHNFLSQQVKKVETDLSQNVDPVKDLYLVEAGVDFFEARMDQAVGQFLADLGHHG
jgi:hypothetical protein